MKLTFTSFLFFISLHVAAQWSDTTNLFTDSLHMQTTNASYNQSSPIIVRSYPDSGYFVIWQDSRNDHNNSKTVVFAQKYSKNGVALWAANGIPVSTSANSQHYTYQGQDYRNRSYAATDSANGFFIAYADDSVTNYVYQRACLQHVKSNGTTVFGGPGYIIKSSTTANLNISPQLIADGAGGFFYSFIGAAPVVGTPNSVFLYCYKEVSGTLQSYGGGQMNENAVQVTATSPCGNYTYLNYPDAEVKDYNIFSDWQGGCNVVMQLNVNGQGPMLGYNKLWRAKKTSTAVEYSLDDKYNPVAGADYYTKGNVYRLYYLKTDHQTISCGSSSNVYTVTQYRLVQNGFLEVDGGPTLYDLDYPKGVTVTTTGNINVAFLASWKRTYITSVSDPFVEGYVIKDEIYDSIPYQRTSNTNPNYPGYNTVEPGSLNKLTFFRDTILPSPFNYDFGLSGGSNQVYATAVQSSGGFVNLQRLAIEKQTADSFAVIYKTGLKQGTVIGQGSYSSPPQICVNKNGNALFYVKEYDGSTGPVRVSPVLSGTQLAWGAMGETIGTGVWSGYYDVITPVVSLDPVNGTGLIAWTDTRNNGTTGYDIYVRHLDDLNKTDYKPPYKRVRSMPNPYGPVITTAVLFGTTNTLTTFDAYGPYGDAGYSPAVDISDNYNLGSVTVKVYENTSGIRTTSGKAYLDRSYTITPANNPNGSATITVRLFFTTAEFNALKTADPSITTPADLAVIKQPGTGSGSTYSVVAGEQTVAPLSWAAVTGGYYIEIKVTGFSNFFISKNTASIKASNWTGTVSTAWENPSNWSTGKVPDANTDVYIAAPAPNYPVVSSMATCRSLATSPGITVQVSTGFKLTVAGSN
ncbi:hypothetical protein [Ferruginibacter albus]|uniref:hypothetical protein n=1 Tax=Ferruginibacter albus TaxID=2875540 RepID=UPI001CC5A021|nr:hypothetical protein [Ferruginibacter albus]UAY52022.1 hypothetical protein K9M53_15690 [Ferruginibacter albus]